jgi:hypothetical protein
MKIELEIDDKYKDTNLRLFWGMVPIARRLLKNQYWELKTGFCSMCGKCCKLPNVPFKYEKGSCEFLEESPGNGKICSLKNFRPVGCSQGNSPLPECTVKWERYK